MYGYACTFIHAGDADIPCVLPVTQADPSAGRENDSRPSSVVDVLKESFHEDFQAALECYADCHPEDIKGAIGVKDALLGRVLKTVVTDVRSSLDQPIDMMAVDLSVRASVEVSVPVGDAVLHGGHSASDTHETASTVYRKKVYNIVFKMRYYLDLRPCGGRCMGPLVAPAQNFPVDWIAEPGEYITDQYLLPTTDREGIQSLCRQMMEKYYPEALTSPSRVDGMELARRMGYTVKRVLFAGGKRDRGRAIFAPTMVTLLDSNGQQYTERMKPGTILIYTNVCRGEDDENGTIIHECSHLHFNRPFFFLQIISGKKTLRYSSRTEGTGRYQTGGPIARMERQAEKLTACIMMEQRNTKAVIEKILAENGGVRTPENMDRAMNQLAATFGVSKLMAKYRMVELGYPEAEGIYNFVDRKFCPDHGCAEDWKPGVTYTVSFGDAASLAGRSAAFHQEATSGRYAYLEGHFCLNTVKYVSDDGAHRRLTAYARHHIDECCIAFRAYSSGLGYDAPPYERYSAGRKKPADGRCTCRYEFAAAPGTPEWEQENKRIMDGAAAWGDLIDRMPRDFRTALGLVLDAVGVSMEGLAEKLCVDRRTVFKWTASGRVSLRHAAAICVALGLPANVGSRLAWAGRAYARNMEEERTFEMFMCYAKWLTLDRCNEMLASRGMEPLVAGLADEGGPA